MSNPTNKQITYLNIVKSTEDSTVEEKIPFRVLAKNVILKQADQNNVEYTLENFGILNATPGDIDKICDFVFPTTE